MKILHELEQGSPQWFQERCGLISASHAHEIVTPGKLQQGKANAYADRLAAERFLGEPVDSKQATQAMERGNDLESDGRLWLSCELDVDIDEVGLILSDCGRYCVSPDGVIAESAGVEIKSRLAVAHAKLVREHRANKDNPHWYDKGAKMQIQMGLWVTGWPRWIYLAHCPGFPNVVREYAPLPEAQDALSEYLPAFHERVDLMVADMRALQSETGSQADADAAIWQDN